MQILMLFFQVPGGPVCQTQKIALEYEKQYLACTEEIDTQFVEKFPERNAIIEFASWTIIGIELTSFSVWKNNLITKKPRKAQKNSDELYSYEEVPVVRDIIKDIGTVLKIKGNGFSSIMSVYFGPIQAKTIVQSPILIDVETPSNLGHQDISLLRKVGLVPQEVNFTNVPILIFDN
ncbi:hypothetical protein HK096_004786, partial [Nowakowskiella sp. JEL0078]